MLFRREREGKGGGVRKGNLRVVHGYFRSVGTAEDTLVPHASADPVNDSCGSEGFEDGISCVGCCCTACGCGPVYQGHGEEHAGAADGHAG